MAQFQISLGWPKATTLEEKISSVLTENPMLFTTKLLKGCILSDVVNVINRYLAPKNPNFKQLCTFGIIEQLLEYCQYNNVHYSYYNDGIYYACEDGYLEVVELTIKKGANKWNDGFSGACQFDQLDIAKRMIEAGANDFNDGLGYLCISGNHGSTINCSNRVEMVKLIIEADNKIQKSCNNYEIDNVIIDSDNKIKKHNNNYENQKWYNQPINKYKKTDWNTGFISACSGGNIEIVKLMIQQGANDWDYGFRNACREGNLELVELMIKNGANNWNEGLELACIVGDIEISKLMIKNGADNFNDGLEPACKYGYLEIIKLLIKNGANNLNEGLKCVDKNYIKSKIRLEIIDFLIKNGASDTNSENNLHTSEKEDDDEDEDKDRIFSQVIYGRANLF
jgi:hypothetical protein